jgi:hypothetical protein
MSLFPERGGVKPVSSELAQSVPDNIELTPELKAQGIEAVETNVTAQVKDGSQHLIQTPANQIVAVKIPNTQENLLSWSKGSIVDSITWLAMFWLRMIKKALALGQKVEVKN